MYMHVCTIDMYVCTYVCGYKKKIHYYDGKMRDKYASNELTDTGLAPLSRAMYVQASRGGMM